MKAQTKCVICDDELNDMVFYIVDFFLLLNSLSSYSYRSTSGEKKKEKKEFLENQWKSSFRFHFIHAQHNEMAASENINK